MTTKEYKIEMIKKLMDLNELILEINELFEECENKLIEDGKRGETIALHEWFSNGYPFDKDFEHDLPWAVDAWGIELSKELDESEVE